MDATKKPGRINLVQLKVARKTTFLNFDVEQSAGESTDRFIEDIHSPVNRTGSSRGLLTSLNITQVNSLKQVIVKPVWAKQYTRLQTHFNSKTKKVFNIALVYKTNETF